MKIIVSALVAATLVAGAAMPADAASNGRDRGKAARNGEAKPCVVVGWTDWSLTRPIFKCRGEEGYPDNRSRRQ